MSDRLNRGDLFTDAEFAAWDDGARPLLCPSEFARFQKPLRPNIRLDADTVQYGRIFHFIKILWARQGAEKLMKDTGF
ncbi:hypothetical protein IVB15_22370 [Bradyrhizobium sp. 182]|uniref:hypothetical protein n=1 Tax=unclassified Bradyrhizobium TaxID=2631580 RepID=UPI001FF93C23|nr:MULTISPECIES: hypothetical protein [unclassified Bradyrhizobium]MCK1425358.1 hypothetical protein [Bradyrhizobium sp. CW12]MCK1530392.1 hypothetical protein [Bradyrhizobium sp. 182]MCK1644251.1 hypothetical protein [Bradyrhizobium sp. 154]